MNDESRLATPADIDELVRLAAIGRDLIRDARGGAMWLARQAPPEPLDETFGAAIADDAATIQVGCIDDVPLGFSSDGGGSCSSSQPSNVGLGTGGLY